MHYYLHAYADSDHIESIFLSRQQLQPDYISGPRVSFD
jgi:hypothetical protein